MPTLAKPQEGEDVRMLHRDVGKLVQAVNALTNMTGVWNGEAKGQGRLAIKGDKSELIINVTPPIPKGGGGAPPTVVSLVSSENPSHHGDPVTFTAAVPMPIAGTITFYIDNVVFASVTVSPFDGTAVSPSIDHLESGPHDIVAYYTGNHPPGIAYLTQQVGQKIVPPMGFLIAPNPAGLHAQVEFRADLPADATGTVDFYLDGFALGTAGLIDGVGILLSTSSLMTAGIHATLASYGGDDKYQSKEVIGVPLTISSTPGVAVEVVSNNNPAATTESIQWGAKIYPNPSTPTVMPTGTVQFYIEGQTFGPPSVVSVGAPGSGFSTAISQVTNAPNGLRVGNNDVSADYSGDTHYYPSSGDMTQIILVVTDISVDCEDDEPMVGVDTKLICHVPEVSGFAPATGNVDFFVDGGYQDSGFLHGTNEPPPGMQIAETDSFSFNSGGNAIIRAEYEGDGTYAGVFEEHSIFVFELASQFEFEDWGWAPDPPYPYNTATRGWNFKMRNPTTDRCIPVAIRVTRAAWNNFGSPLFVGGYDAGVSFNASQWQPVPPDQGMAQVVITVSAPAGTFLPIWFQVEMEVLFPDGHTADAIYGTGNPRYPWINNGPNKIIMTDV